MLKCLSVSIPIKQSLSKFSTTKIFNFCVWLPSLSLTKAVPIVLVGVPVAVKSCLDVGLILSFKFFAIKLFTIVLFTPVSIRNLTFWLLIWQVPVSQNCLLFDGIKLIELTGGGVFWRSCGFTGQSARLCPICLHSKHLSVFAGLNEML